MHPSARLRSVSFLLTFIHCWMKAQTTAGFHVMLTSNTFNQIKCFRTFLHNWKRNGRHSNTTWRMFSALKLVVFTFTRHVHTEVDAIYWIHIDCARLHEHGHIPLCAFASCWVWSLILPSKVGFGLYYSPSQLSTMWTPVDQHLRGQWTR